jgi:hypothetical protein
MAATTLAVIGASTALAGAYQDSIAMGIQADQEKLNAQQNAEILAIRAKEAAANSEKQAAQLKLKANQIKGAQKAALAASGVVVDYGSGAKIQEETELFAALDSENIKTNAYAEAWGFKFQAGQTLAQGNFNAMALKNKAKATLLTGVGNAANYGLQGFSKLPVGTSTPEASPQTSPQQQSQMAYSRLFQSPRNEV